MNAYLENTKVAASLIIDGFASEMHDLNKSITRFKEGGDWMTDWNEEMDGKNLLETMLDKDNFLPKMREMSKMVELMRESSIEMDRLSSAIKDREFATQVLCGSLLQIGKQGISSVHGGLAACPNGRNIGSQRMKNVIWQGRNQSMHYGEDNPHKPVINCFKQLDADFGTSLAADLNSGVNLATHVIDRLGWYTYEAYEADMVSLLP